MKFPPYSLKLTKKAYKKALIPGQGRELARGTTLVMNLLDRFITLEP
ncbi:alanyl-tRNA synthetase [Bacillus sp. SG-1]|nr:alanyl-tRNA synthetase [Bacillus sp. SG-1]